MNFDPVTLHFLSSFGFLSVCNLALADAGPEQVEATYSSIILAGKSTRSYCRNSTKSSHLIPGTLH